MRPSIFRGSVKKNTIDKTIFSISLHTAMRVLFLVSSVLLLANCNGDDEPPLPTRISLPQPTAAAEVTSTPSASDELAFYVYQDADSPDNHYTPSGYMGDTGDILIHEAFEENPHTGRTCIRVVYDTRGRGPNACPYSPPCKWAGVYWQEPPNNWGTDGIWAERGFDLSDYSRLIFWARADEPSDVEFKVGGIAETYGDSLVFPRSIIADLTEEWQEFEIDLEGANLTHIIGGFVWTTNWDTNPDGVTFYLDDIRFE